jgi:hypothetical protein
MTVVFTTILGASDSLKPAPSGADRCVCLVDDLSKYPDPNGWELIEIKMAVAADPRRLAWRFRCLPDTVFDTYDRVVWVDASFTLTNLPALLKDAGDAPIAALRHHARHSPYDEAAQLVKVGQARPQDIDPQVRAYRGDGFNPFHLSISCIIVRDRSRIARSFNETWAREIDWHLGDNTQISLDYSAWKAGTEIRALRGSRHDNPYSVHDHLDHKKRRQPYRVPA